LRFKGISGIVFPVKHKTEAAASPPGHIAIVMDGNGRWASKRGLPRSAGHAAGAENFRSIATYCKDIGVKYLTVYAFSSENWKRPADEISAIMSLFANYLRESIEKMERDNIRLRILGDISVLSDELKELITETNAISEKLCGFQANVCVNNGGRSEIVRAAELLRNEPPDEPVTEESFSRYLWTAGLPDPDLLIRPGGETRLSNFLLWQCAYSEFYFTDTLWPDFTPDELDKAIASYNNRERRYGGIS